MPPRLQPHRALKTTSNVASLFALRLERQWEAFLTGTLQVLFISSSVLFTTEQDVTIEHCSTMKIPLTLVGVSNENGEGIEEEREEGSGVHTAHARTRTRDFQSSPSPPLPSSLPHRSRPSPRIARRPSGLLPG